MSERFFRKDESLDRLAELINVAQFVSFSPRPSLTQEFARVLGYEPNHKFSGVRDAVSEVLTRSPEHSVNVRSFAPDDTQSHEFLYGLTDVDAVVGSLGRISDSGLHVIVNETVDVRDGGVSGVVQGGTIEFSPDDTPRCVEKPGIASMPETLGKAVLSRVYGVALNFPISREDRLEFTLHPKPRGWKHTHVLGWELERVGVTSIKPVLSWPNNFSRLIGDKAFGLVVAAELELPVPKSLVISRRIAPFTFGRATGSLEWWFRTCPREQVPGRFTTHHGWIDPFALLATEDPLGNEISSVLAQSAVVAEYSGALIAEASGRPVVEGRKGEGENLMKGIVFPEKLPPGVVADVLQMNDLVCGKLGPARFEWVHDGKEVWIVQLHTGATLTMGRVLVPGRARTWHRFDASQGLEALRSMLAQLHPEDGIEVRGQIGLTSHVADVIRRAGKPARLTS
jgi:hypothetical protein